MYTDIPIRLLTNIIKNTIHANIQFTIKKETQKKLNYLELTITNLHNALGFNIFRKSASTGMIVHDDYCHPQEYKNAAVIEPINSMNTCPITDAKLQHITTVALHTNTK